MGLGICSQSISFLGRARPDIIYTYAWVCPHAQGTMAQSKCLHACLPVCEVKAMYYLSDCWVLYVRKEAAICALGACVLQSQPGKQAHLRLRRSLRGVTSFTGYVCSIPSHPCSFSASLVGPLGSSPQDISSEGPSAGTIGWAGPSSPTCVPILSGLGHTLHDAPGFQELSGRWRESNLERSHRNDVKNIKQ